MMENKAVHIIPPRNKTARRRYGEAIIGYSRLLDSGCASGVRGVREREVGLRKRGMPWTSKFPRSTCGSAAQPMSKASTFVVTLPPRSHCGGPLRYPGVILVGRPRSAFLLCYTGV